jgi:hypothetical protein
MPMRLSYTVPIALLLAAAAAAGAGDDIKWKRSQDLTFVPTTTNRSDVFGTYEDTKDSRTLTWKRSFGNYYVEGITVTYVDWALYCKAAGKDPGQTPESFCWKSLTYEDASKLFQDAVIFYVNLTAWEDYRDLEDSGKWELYLLKNDERCAPLTILKNPATDKPRTKDTAFRDLNSLGLMSGPTIEYDPSVGFSTVFENPYVDSQGPPPPLRLVIECDECRRGFEWRFKQD